MDVEMAALMVTIEDLEIAVAGLILRADRWQGLFWLALGAAILGWLK